MIPKQTVCDVVSIDVYYELASSIVFLIYGFRASREFGGKRESLQAPLAESSLFGRNPLSQAIRHLLSINHCESLNL